MVRWSGADDLLEAQVQSADGYRVGLEAAWLLKRLFPAFYRAHVAERCLTPGAMLGVAQAFLSLANRSSELDLAGDLAIDSDAPCSVPDVQDEDEEALNVLEHVAGAHIAEV